jgi:hypothetical protein
MDPYADIADPKETFVGLRLLKYLTKLTCNAVLVCNYAGTPLELSFNFNDPFSGDAITVKGSGAYNAAVHCGAITMEKQAMPTSPPPASC